MKKNLPDVFEQRKRLTFWELEKIENYINNLYVGPKTKKTYLRGLTEFVMSLKKPLSMINNEDVENYIIQHNSVDLSRRNEMLRTPFVMRFRIPNLPIIHLYNFASRIIYPRVVAKQGGKCAVCGIRGALHLHHQRGKFDLREENLVALCPRCHLMVVHAVRRLLK
jgi:hypothetical protein